MVIAGNGGGGIIIIVTQSTGGAGSDVGALSDIHSGKTSQMIDNHKDVATEPVGPLFLVYDPVLANLFGIYV
jgi:hypothetical protein